MKRALAIILSLSLAAQASAYDLGVWAIDDALTFPANTHNVSTGAASDADSVPTYRVYEDETGTAILNGSMAKLDDANTVGFYTEQLTLSAANGFEIGKCYTIYVTATTDSVASTTSHTFSIGAAINVTSGRVDANLEAAEGTDITENFVGGIAGSIEQFFDVNTPTGTVNSLPDAVPGAANGLVIAGTNAPILFTGASPMRLISTSGNGHGLQISGNGTGDGINSVGGATGNGLDIAGGGTAGPGMRITATDGIGLSIVGGTAEAGLSVQGGASNGHAVSFSGQGAGEGLSISGGATGHGIEVLGGATSGSGLLVSTTSGDGISVTGGTNGNGMSLTGTGAGEGLKATGGATGNGFEVDGGASGDDLVLTGDDAPDLAGVVWNALKASHTTADSFGDYLDDEVSEAGDPDAVADAVWTEVIADHSGTAGSTAEYVDAIFDFLNGAATFDEAADDWADAYDVAKSTDTLNTALDSGTAQAGAATTITLAATASAVNDYYNGAVVATTGGTGAGQYRLISDYVGATNVATVARAWTTNPDVTTTYVVLPTGESDVTLVEGEDATAQLQASSGGTPVSPYLVDSDHTWKFDFRNQLTAPNNVSVAIGSDDVLTAVDFTVPMPAFGSISSVTSVTVADQADKTEPTLGTPTVSADKRKAVFTVDATAASAATYVITAKVLTTDGQTFVRKGRLVIE